MVANTCPLGSFAVPAKEPEPDVISNTWPAAPPPPQQLQVPLRSMLLAATDWSAPPAALAALRNRRRKNNRAGPLRSQMGLARGRRASRDVKTLHSRGGPLVSRPSA